MPNYEVKQGDCIESIAFQHGLFWGTVWNHAKNLNLREKRKDPNVLFPGDVVFVPEKEKKHESGVTEQRHRFKRKGVPLKIRLRLFIGDEPRADESYVLVIDGHIFTGTTGANGEVEHPIPPDAKNARLVVGEEQEEYVLDLGHMNPIKEISGIQARLNNLGFDCGAVDGILGPKTEAALRKFQKEYNLAESGNVDEETCNKLLDVHDHK
jgi:hypothetical protein